MPDTTVDADLLQTRYRLTRQRAAVLRALGENEHLSADAIFARVRLEMPSISLGTVYRTLDVLRSLGLVQLFAFGTEAARFEATLERHHHLVCGSCRAISNVEIAALAPVAREIAGRHRYDDVEFSLTIVGRCPACRESPAT